MIARVAAPAAFLVFSLLLLLGGFTAAATPVAVDPAAAFRNGGCPLCHDVPGVAAASRAESCAGCHRWVKDVAADPASRTAAMRVFPLWPRYERNVATYLPVPDLAAAMTRLDPVWVRSWLGDPHDVRPGLPEGMPRFALSDAELDAIEGAFAAARVSVPATPAPNSGNVERGEALFREKGCATCHAFGGRHGPGTPLAPDLAHARARMTPDAVAAWIADPKSLAPSATMPALGLAREDVLALRDYVLLAPPDARPAGTAGPVPVAAARPVAWAEVEERVFGKICVHCHMDPAQNQGRRGPGNAGGFGWPETGIELQTPDGVAAVADRIPAALLRRRDEACRDTVAWGESPAAIARPEEPGMPLGLPPIPDDDIALVLAWIAQGMPR